MAGKDRHNAMMSKTKAHLKKTLNRKGERKQKRDDKKANRQASLKRLAERKKAWREQEEEARAVAKAGRKRTREESEASPSAKKASKTRKTKSSSGRSSDKKSSSSSATPAFLNPEDEEIEYLERKLGLRGSDDKRDKNWDRLVKELQMDGFDEDLLAFVGDLDKGKSITDLEKEDKRKGKLKPSKRDQEFLEDGSDDEIHEAVESEVHNIVRLDSNKQKLKEKKSKKFAEMKDPIQLGEDFPSDIDEDEEDDFFDEDEDEDDDDDDDGNERLDQEDQDSDVEGEDDEDEDEEESVEDEEEESDEDEEEESDEDEEDELSEDDRDEDDEDAEDALADAEVATENVTYLPKSNLYGKEEPSEGDSSEAADGAAPRRRSKFFEKFGGEKLRLRRYINGLINRLTEDNMQPLATQIATLYHEHPRSMVSESFAEVILSGLMNDVIVMTTLATNFAGLVATLCHVQGADVGSTVLEQLVIKFEKILSEADENQAMGNDDEEVVANRRGANLAVFLSHLVSFGVSSTGLVFDLLDRLTETELDGAQVETFITIINECGHRLRKSDPARLLRVIERLQALDNRDEATQGEVGHSRRDFLLEEIYALKNNKKRNESVEERIKRVMRFVRQVRTSTDSRFVSLQLPWNDLLHAEERGRWWIVGGVWKDQDEQLRRNKEMALAKAGASGAGGLGGQNPISRALAKAPMSLLDLAKRQHMNTDARRAIFCEIMSADDAFDGVHRLSALNLRDRQEREIAQVIARCCGASKTYNPYFGELAVKLCQQKPQFKFTFQLLFWDKFKEMESLKPRQVSNLAKLLAQLMLHFTLSLAALKSVDFASLEDEGVAFFNVFFASLLCYGGEDRDAARRVAKTINRLGGSKEFSVVSDGILLFFHRHLLIPDGPDSLLAKRVKMMKRIIDALVLKRSLNEDPVDDMF